VSRAENGLYFFLQTLHLSESAKQSFRIFLLHSLFSSHSFHILFVPSGKIFRMDMRESKAAFSSVRPAEQPSCRERAHGRFSPQLKSYPDNVIKKAAQDVNMLNGYRTPNVAKKVENRFARSRPQKPAAPRAFTQSPPNPPRPASVAYA